jgi:hypothetical protein
MFVELYTDSQLGGKDKLILLFSGRQNCNNWLREFKGRCHLEDPDIDGTINYILEINMLDEGMK